MNKSDIVNNVHSQLGLTKKVVSKIVDSVFNEMRSCILNGEDIKLSTFGNFEVQKRGKRIGRNPKTGEAAIIKSRSVIVFKPSKILKDDLNNA